MNASSSPPEPIEAEFKLRLADESQRRRLLEHVLRPGARPGPGVRQENRFFDSTDRALRRARHALRLRQEEGDWSLTLKGPPLSAAGAGLERRAEEERALSASEAQEILDGHRSPLSFFLAPPASALARAASERLAGEPLIALGGFSNERLRLTADEVLPELGVGIELDRTAFPGPRTDLELEVELGPGDDPARVERALRALLDRAGIPWVPADTKAGRFFRILDRLARNGGKPGS